MGKHLVTKTIVSRAALGILGSERAAHEMARAVLARTDLDALGDGLIEYPVVAEGPEYPYEFKASVMIRDGQPECWINLSAETQEDFE